MWCWMIFLGVASSVAVLYRLCCIFLPGLRTFMLWEHASASSKWKDAFEICRKRPYGDWFLLRQLYKNVDRETFHDFLRVANDNKGLTAEYKPPRLLGRPSLATISTAGGWLRPQPGQQGSQQSGLESCETDTDTLSSISSQKMHLAPN